MTSSVRCTGLGLESGETTLRAMLTVEDYREQARRRLPKLVFEYIDGGAESEYTVAANLKAFESVSLRPHGGMDPTGIEIGVSVLGSELSMPVILAPCGSAGVVRSSGDIAGARAASAAGTIFTHSTMSSDRIE